MKNITKSNEDYLESILLLEKNGATRSIDVANDLGVSKAAVSFAMDDLIKKGLVNKESYGDIILTEAGRKIALEVFDKHELIKKVLIGIGVSDETAEIECCKIEHILSDETIRCLTKISKANKF